MRRATPAIRGADSGNPGYRYRGERLVCLLLATMDMPAERANESTSILILQESGRLC